MKKISIVMAYFNRLEQLKFTLDTISQSKYPYYEVIIVDDGSEEDQDPEQLKDKYPFIKVIKVDKKTKKHINPCVAYNIGFKEANGEFVIIQNPEVCHIGDIISYVAENLDEEKYLTFTCANIPKENLNKVLHQKYQNGIEEGNNFLKVRDFILELEKTNPKKTSVWYNHIKHRRGYYHFCSAITKNNLNMLGGFDQRYAHGIGMDDAEFVKRIYHILKLKVSIVPYSDPFSIHQWHSRSYRNNYPASNGAIFKQHMIELGLSPTYLHKEKRI